jgi:molybdenum cofactor cytidylyltransferase
VIVKGLFIEIEKRYSATDINQIHTDNCGRLHLRGSDFYLWRIAFILMLSIAAIILAAGSGSRMGLTKQLLKIDGESLIRRTAQAAIDARLDPIIVVTGSDAENVGDDLAGLSVTIAQNRNWKNGIGTSIRHGISTLLATNTQIDAATILLCDQARLTSEVLRNLIATFSASHKPIAACEYENTVGPPCCFNRETFAELSQIADTDGAKKVLLKDPSRLTKIPWPAGADDVDTPADWRRINP